MPTGVQQAKKIYEEMLKKSEGGLIGVDFDEGDGSDSSVHEVPAGPQRAPPTAPSNFTENHAATKKKLINFLVLQMLKVITIELLKRCLRK